MSTRDDLAKALAGAVLVLALADDEQPQRAVYLAASPHVPDVISAWDVWPVWQSSRWLSACAIEETWQVLLALPAVTTDQWAEALDVAPDVLRAALQSVGTVTRAEPIVLLTGSGSTTIPALALTLTI